MWVYVHLFMFFITKRFLNRSNRLNDSDFPPCISNHHTSEFFLNRSNILSDSSADPCPTPLTYAETRSGPVDCQLRELG